VNRSFLIAPIILPVTVLRTVIEFAQIGVHSGITCLVVGLDYLLYSVLDFMTQEISNVKLGCIKMESMKTNRTDLVFILICYFFVWIGFIFSRSIMNVKFKILTSFVDNLQHIS
jgi:hypothetical protein